MWNIANLSIGTSSGAYSLIGGLAGKEAVSPKTLGPEGAVYILSVAGVGYIKFQDIGANGSGPGSWRIQFSNASANWSYEGNGQASISVDQYGGYTVTGGSNSISGKVYV